MISSIAIHLPSRQLSNEDLAAIFPEWAAEKIYEKTGIRTRHIAEENECASDLAFLAADKLLAESDRSTVDFLIFCTQSPDYLLPTSACLLQDRLRLSKSTGAFDMNLGCSGFIYGLSLSQALIASGQASRVLLLNADTYSKFIRPDDKNTRTIFGDAAAATLLDTRSKNRLHSFVFGTDGSGAEQLILKGSANRRTEPSPEAELPKRCVSPALFMNGPEVFNFTIKTVPGLIEQTLRKGGLTLPDIDYFVFHQANAFMLEHLRKKIGIPKEKFCLCLEECGNTVSATIPIALNQLIESGNLRRQCRILLAGFGVGLSWAGCILEWNTA